MNAQELRIGNLIEFKNDATSGSYVKFEVQDFNVLDRIKPIKLTEELLLRFGFKELLPKDGIAESYIKNKLRIDISNSGNTYYKRLSVPSVHRLQNLYFALTNEELTII